VLKNRATDKPLFVVIFTLLPKHKEEDKSKEAGENASNVDDELD
jgi:hypothetical protein